MMQTFMRDTKNNLASLESRISRVEEYIDEIRKARSEQEVQSSMTVSIPLSTESPETKLKSLTALAASKIPKRQEEKLGSPSMWDAAMQHVVIGNLDTAYSKILSSGTTIQLIRLMEKTGNPVHFLYKRLRSRT